MLGLAAGAVLTGVLHLDALADTADALGAATRERALEIMRDHSIGAYGAVALCVLLHAALLLAAVAAVAVVAYVAAGRWLGGVTGDVLGAAAELAELAALVVAVAVT